MQIYVAITFENFPTVTVESNPRMQNISSSIVRYLIYKEENFLTEPDLFTRIHATCGRVALADHATALLHPLNIRGIGKIVPDPQHDHQDDTDRKDRPDHIVDRDGRLCPQ